MASRQSALHAAASPLYDQYLKLLQVGSSYGENREQALKECTKRLKKHPKNAALLLWKAEELRDLGRKQELLTALQNLCTLSPAVQESKLVVRVHELLSENEGRKPNTVGENSAKLWSRAIGESNKANKLALAKTWLWTSIKSGCWLDALKAVEEILPREDVMNWHAFKTVNAAMADFSAAPKDDHKSYKIIWVLTDKYMTANVETSGGLFEPKTTRDLRLVYDVIRQAFRSGINVEEINSEAWSIRNDIDQGASLSELEFIYKKMEILAHFKHWKTLFHYCLQFLTEETWCQELRVWEFLLEAERGVKSGLENDDEQKISTKGLIEELLKKHSKSRTAMRMQILVDKPPQQAPTLQTVQSYFDTFNDQYHCFEDLRVLIRQLAGDRIDSFLSHAVQSSSFSLDALTDVIRSSSSPVPKPLAKLNILKIVYCLHISRSTVPDDLQHYASDALYFYETSLKAKSPDDDATSYEEDDACVLGVLALLKLQKLRESSGSAENNTPLIRAAALLMRAAARSPKNQDILQLSVALYLHLGLPSLAIGSYKALRVKESLHETLAHLLYTRLSTQHPFAVKLAGDDDRFDPRQELKSILDYFLKALRQANKFLGGEANATHPDTIIEFQQLKSSFQNSFTRKLCLLERRRIGRLTGLPGDPEGYVNGLEDEWVDHSADNRDFKTMPDYEGSNDLWLDKLLKGSEAAPGQYWLSLFTEVEHLTSLVPDQKPFDPKRKAFQAQPDKSAELTEWEQRMAVAWTTLRPLLRTVILGSTAEATVDLHKELAAPTCIERFLEANPVSPPVALDRNSNDKNLPEKLLPPSLHSVFLRLEYLSAAARLCQAALKPPPDSAQKTLLAPHAAAFKRIFLAVMKYHAALRAWATSWKNTLTEDAAIDAVMHAISPSTKTNATGGSVEERLEKLEVGEKEEEGTGATALNAVLAEILDPEFGADFKHIAAALVGSAAEAIDGFLLVKKL